MIENVSPEMRQLAMQAAFNRYMPAGAPMEYSASKGFLPYDMGNYGQYTNIVQDWMDPTILNLILASSGLGQPAAPAATGRMTLEAVLENTDGNAWEAVLARALLDGSSPSQAVEETLNFFDEFAPEKIPSDSDQWRKDVAGKAETWFQGLVNDSVNTAASASQNDPLGLNSLGDVFQAEELNPFLPDALANSEAARAEALAGMREDRMAALDERMGDTEAYADQAMQSYLNNLSDFDRERYERQLQEAGNARSMAQNSSDVASVIDPDSKAYEELANGVSEIDTQEDWLARYEAAGMPYGPDWRTGDFWALPANRSEAVERARRDAEDPYRDMNNIPSGMQPTPIVTRQTSTPMRDVMESEIRRDLSKARNNNAMKDYSLSSATSDKVNAAKKADERTFEEAARALAAQNFYKSLGITPRSVRVNSVLRGGQSLFGN